VRARGIDIAVDELLSVPEAAAHLGVSERFARRLVAERRVPVQHVGRHVRIRRSALDRWLATQEQPAVAPLPPTRSRRSVAAMTKKNSSKRSFGTVGRLPSGRYRARYRDPATGQQVSGGTFPSRADAERWLAAAQIDQARGAWVDPRAGEVLLRDYAEGWLAQHTGLRETTHSGYRYLLAHYICPVLGGTPIGRLTPGAVREWYSALHASRPAAASAAYRLLRAILNTAVADERIVRNPCQVRGAGSETSPERPIASIAEVQAAAATMPEHLRLAVLLAAWCQLRRGEVLGLQRGDVDLLHETLTIERAVVRPPGGRPFVGPPKTAAGRRSLAVPPNIVPDIEAHLARFVGPEADAWLFPGETGTLSPNTIERAWYAARLTVGRPDLHFHDLRHSGLTWAAATGASTKELMARGGHSTATVALRYQHATEDRDRALAAALAGLVRPAAVVPLRRDSGVTHGVVNSGQ
jgi:excisionase family DNA binding protein